MFSASLARRSTRCSTRWWARRSRRSYAGTNKTRHSSPAEAGGDVLTPAAPEMLGRADTEAIAAAAALINGAERPVLMLGLLASQPRAAEAVHVLLAKTKLAVVCTYQGAGVVPREFFDCFG